MAQVEEHISITGKWPLSAYTWKTERFLERYAEGLGKKKIFGARCSNCGAIFIPPVLICPRCHFRLELHKDQNWIPVADNGTVIAYTISYMNVGQGLHARTPEKRPIFILVRPDGADTHIFAELMDAEEDSIRIGMRVKVAWPEAPAGNLGDILYFKPF